MYKHGIGVTEQATSIITPIEGTAGLQVIFGTAPVNLAENPYDATNKLQIVYSFKEACQKVGYSDDFKNYTLCQSIDACFRVFNVAPIILVNVLDPKVHKKDNEEKTYNVVGGEVVVDIKGILLDTIVVKNKAGDKTYEQDVDYIASFNEDGHVVLAITSAGAAKSETELKIKSTSINPEAVEKEDIIGGYNVETGEEKGMELIRQVYPKLGLTPGLILAPGWSHLPNVAAVIEAKTENINGLFKCEAVVDLDTTKAKTYDTVKEAKEETGFASKHTIVCWPKGKIGDKEYYLSSLVGALIAYTDASNSDIPNLSPSNKSIKITGTVLEDGTEVLLDIEQANLVNSYGVLTAINMNGWKSWGNNTACYPSNTDPKDRWIGVRRFFTWWGNTFILTYFQKVDDNTNYRLIQSVVDSENIRGNSFQARGYCAGAKIQFLSGENPITDILNGTIRFHQMLAPYTPAEYIENTLEFDPSMIETALTGGGN